jgi:hypothetical protein
LRTRWVRCRSWGFRSRRSFGRKAVTHRCVRCALSSTVLRSLEL